MFRAGVRFAGMKAVLRKRIVLFGAAAATLALAVLAPERAQRAAPAAARETATPAMQPGAPAAAALSLPQREGLNRSRGELFGTPPPPPPPRSATAQPAAPVAPPMPYRFAGRVRQGD